jgi:hypothetical protein
MFAACTAASSPETPESCSVGEVDCNMQDIVQCNDSGEWEYVRSCSVKCLDGQCEKESTNDGDMDRGHEGEIDTDFDGEQDVDPDTDGDIELEQQEIDRWDNENRDNIDELIDGDLDDELEFSEDEAEFDSESNDNFDEDHEYQDLPCQLDEYGAENNSPETAVTIDLPYYSRSMSLCDEDEDWYVFSVPPNKTVHAIMNYPDYEGIIHLVLYRSGFESRYDWLIAEWSQPQQSEIIYSSSSAEDYLLLVWGKRLPVKNYLLDVWLEGDDFRPENDNCDNPNRLIPGQSLEGTTLGAFDDVQLPCSDSFGPDVVYRLSWPEQRTAVIVLESDFDAVLSLHPMCLDMGSNLGCADEFYYEDSETLRVVNLAPGDYYLWVDGANVYEAGSFSISASLEVTR